MGIFTLIAAVLTAILTFGGWTPVLAAHAATEADQHWARTGGAAVVTVFDELDSPTWTRILRKSVAEWNAGVGHVDLVFGASDVAVDCVNGHGPHTVVVCFHDNADPNHVGETYWTQNGAHIQWAVVWIDSRQHPRSDRASLMCHEFGHVLGLEHRPATDRARTCMTSGEGAAQPDRQDFAAVTRSHAHRHES